MLEKILGKIPDKYRTIISWGTDIAFLILMVMIFFYAQDMNQKRHQICYEPEKLCPGGNVNISYPYDIDILNTTPDKVSLGKNIYYCVEYCVERDISYENCKCMQTEASMFTILTDPGSLLRGRTGTADDEFERPVGN